MCVCSNLDHLLLCIIADSPRAAGSFSRDFTTNLAPQYMAFSRALEIEKLKAPLIPGRKGTGDTNDWCISHGSDLFGGDADPDQTASGGACCSESALFVNK